MTKKIKYRIHDDLVQIWLKKIREIEEGQCFLIHDNIGKKYILKGVGRDGITCQATEFDKYYHFPIYNFNALEVKNKFSDYFYVEEISEKNGAMITIAKDQYNEFIKYKSLMKTALSELSLEELELSLEELNEL